jgi:hypothetical protein
LLKVDEERREGKDGEREGRSVDMNVSCPRAAGGLKNGRRSGRSD